MRQLARELRNNSTLPEVILWKHIKNRAFNIQFHRQVPMLDYIVDFYCHEIMLAIEVDGENHNFQVEYDALREERLGKEGVVFLRFSNKQIMTDLSNVLVSIEQSINNLKC